MATKKTKSRKPARKRVETPNTIWYAGLGAASLTRKRYGVLVDRLVVEGRRLQGHARVLAANTAEQVRKQAVKAWTPMQRRALEQIDTLQGAVDQGLGRVRSALGIPSKADVEALSRQVAALSRRVKASK